MRVTETLVPAGNAEDDVRVPVTVSCWARGAVAGAFAVRVVGVLVGASRIRSVYTSLSFSDTANSLLSSGAHARPRGARVSEPLLLPVLGKSYCLSGVDTPCLKTCTSGSYQEKVPAATSPFGAMSTAFG